MGRILIRRDLPVNPCDENFLHKVAVVRCGAGEGIKAGFGDELKYHRPGSCRAGTPVD